MARQNIFDVHGNLLDGQMMMVMEERTYLTSMVIFWVGGQTSGKACVVHLIFMATSFYRRLLLLIYLGKNLRDLLTYQIYAD